MGFFRGSFLIFFCTLLFLSFLGMNIFFTLSSSLEYDQVSSKIVPLVYSFGDENSLASQAFGTTNFNFSQATQSNLAKMKQHCASNTDSTDYVFDYQGSTIVVSCETLKSGGAQAVVNETIKSYVDGVYYGTYDCSFFSCFQEKQLPLFLVSEKARDYWHQKFFFSLIASLVLILLIFIFIENRLNTPILVGIFLILSAIPILKISAILSAIFGQPISLFFEIFFSQAGKVFWISFLSGLVLVGIGIALRVLDLDFVKRLTQRKEDKGNPVQTVVVVKEKPKGKKKKK